MTAQILDGRAIAAKVRHELGEGVAKFRAIHGRSPGLDVILVGSDPSSQIYVRNKEKAATEVGIQGRVHHLPADALAGDVLGLIAKLNADDAVDGILLQLPLPASLPEKVLLDSIDPCKDVDGLHPLNAGLLLLGRPRLVSPTPRGIMRLLGEAGAPLAGQNALVVGRSNIVGKPIAQLLLAANATVTTAHAQTRGLSDLCRQADVLVVAVGRAHLVRGDWIKPGAVVIDVGTSRNTEGKLAGDVAFEEASERAAWITPVPGGVGPMTIAALLENTLQAANERARDRSALSAS